MKAAVETVPSLNAWLRCELALEASAQWLGSPPQALLASLQADRAFNPKTAPITAPTTPSPAADSPSVWRVLRPLLWLAGAVGSFAESDGVAVNEGGGKLPMTMRS